MFFQRRQHPENIDPPAGPRDHQADLGHLRRSFRIAAMALVIMWFLRFLETSMGIEMIRLAIVPRESFGLIGILTAPWIHGDFAHLISNSLPVLFLGTGLLYLYPRSAPIVLAVVYIGGGLGVWLFARSSAHLGASGVTYGLVTFLFFSGVLRRDPPAIGLSLIVAFLYGGTIWGVLPIEQGVSFESHLAGAVLGLLCALLLRNRDGLRNFSGHADYDVDEEEDELDDPARFNPADALEYDEDEFDPEDYMDRRDY
ncbi:MAG: rhomboid family intramembrane serine protease [bacterium]|nr:rhomboid family intramembrane serine protease [bacterium]